MTKVAVVAHRGKTLGGGLKELRQVLGDRGIDDPLWYEASSSRKLAPLAQRAVAQGAELIFLWGGDGTVQRCVNAIAGEKVTLAILPAGTANLLALNLGVPSDLEGAVAIGLEGDQRRLDVGVLNGKRFAVMAGVGFDALTMRNADDNLKEHIGKLAYVWSGTKATQIPSQLVRIKVDRQPWYEGEATCVLLGQMGSLAKGITIFPDAHPDDGLLEIGVVTAQNAMDWTRVLARMVVGKVENSPLAEVTRGRRVDIELSRPTIYELDGGARKATKRLRATIEPGAIEVCVPRVVAQ
ncbi:MAG: diacylglycerol kinase family lipid kinase [Acidobacteria bacterium]|nr:diacylglycerol kinase family lipid kinase [Acidobacteriota bacterium]